MVLFCLLFFICAIAEETTLDSLVDPRDGQAYGVITIGDQTLMAENLNYGIEDSWCYGDNTANCDQYGRLYTWESALMACPEGWRLPTDEDWESFSAQLAKIYKSKKNQYGYRGLAKALKSNSGWRLNYNGNDRFSFTALPAGTRYSSGKFLNQGRYTSWWSATEEAGIFAWERYIDFNDNTFFRNASRKLTGNSVRCFKGEPTGDHPTLRLRLISEIPDGTLKDNRDGQVYKTISLGEQTIMNENLNFNMDEARCGRNDRTQCGYTWWAATVSCPEGWHLPTDGEWEELDAFVTQNELFKYLKLHTSAWWSNSESDDRKAWIKTYKIGEDSMGTKSYLKSHIAKVRCLKDTEEYKIRMNKIQKMHDTMIAQKNQTIRKGVLKDPRDGQEYKTISIGDQTLMAENLNYTSDQTPSLCYENISGFCKEYGRLYTWESSLLACPDGWHLPTKSEWKKVFATVAEASDSLRYNDEYFGVAKQLKSKTGWYFNLNGHDSFGFAAKPAGRVRRGYRGFKREDERKQWKGGFQGLGKMTRWWSASKTITNPGRDWLEKKEELAWVPVIQYDYSLSDDLINLEGGSSVRCFLGAPDSYHPTSIKIFESKAREERQKRHRKWQKESERAKLREEKARKEHLEALGVVKDSLKDQRDGQVYKTVIVGDQTLMVENLNYELDHSFCYKENPDDCKKDGRLYTWGAAMNACPSGWYLPSTLDWVELNNTISKKNIFKEKWLAGHEKGQGDNLSPIKLIPGIRSDNFFIWGVFRLPRGALWSSSEDTPQRAMKLYRSRESTGNGPAKDSLVFIGESKDHAFPVRCWKD